MDGIIILHNVPYSRPADDPHFVYVYIRKQGQPVEANQYVGVYSVDKNGYFTTPVKVTGLEPNTYYTVTYQMDCGGACNSTEQDMWAWTNTTIPPASTTTTTSTTTQPTTSSTTSTQPTSTTTRTTTTRTTTSTTTSTKATSTTTKTTTSTTTRTTTTTKPTTTTQPIKIWVEDQYSCDQDNPFTLQREVTQMSTPYYLLYDAPTGKVFGLDADNYAQGNIFEYDPNNLNTAADVSYHKIPNADATCWCYCGGVDPIYRRVYAGGSGTKGLVTYNIATGAFLSTKPYGNDEPYDRMLFVITADKLITNSVSNTGAGNMYVWDRATITLQSTMPIQGTGEIPGGKSCLYGAPGIVQVGNEFWVVQSQKPTSQTPTQTPNIMRYDLTFENLLGSIDISAFCSTWAYDGGSNLSYFRTISYVPSHNKVYVFDAGKNNLIAVNTLTLVPTVVKTMTNLLSFTNSFFQIIEDPITGQPYLTGTCQTTLGGAFIKVSYLWDYTLDQVIDVYPNIYMQTMVRIGTSNVLHSNFQGQQGWGGGSTWSTDGGIDIWTR